MFKVYDFEACVKPVKKCTVKDFQASTMMWRFGCDHRYTLIQDRIEKNHAVETRLKQKSCLQRFLGPSTCHPCVIEKSDQQASLQNGSTHTGSLHPQCVCVIVLIDELEVPLVRA